MSVVRFRPWPPSLLPPESNSVQYSNCIKRLLRICSNRTCSNFRWNPVHHTVTFAVTSNQEPDFLRVTALRLSIQSGGTLAEYPGKGNVTRAPGRARFVHANYASVICLGRSRAMDGFSARSCAERPRAAPRRFRGAVSGAAVSPRNLPHRVCVQLGLSGRTSAIQFRSALCWIAVIHNQFRSKSAIPFSSGRFLRMQREVATHCVLPPLKSGPSTFEFTCGQQTPNPAGERQVHRRVIPHKLRSSGELWQHRSGTHHQISAADSAPLEE